MAAYRDGGRIVEGSFRRKIIKGILLGRHCLIHGKITVLLPAYDSVISTSKSYDHGAVWNHHGKGTELLRLLFVVEIHLMAKTDGGESFSMPDLVIHTYYILGLEDSKAIFHTMNLEILIKGF